MPSSLRGFSATAARRGAEPSLVIAFRADAVAVNGEPRGPGRLPSCGSLPVKPAVAFEAWAPVVCLLLMGREDDEQRARGAKKDQ